ncbi:Translin family [Musa troglodytarum]|uniref:Translin family n=1 Tax=Musa troglodytarum TaxID=320322 RepID=A0A9E7K2C0_9LILI|nr:Translin family [Musa troglodytarum]
MRAVAGFRNAIPAPLLSLAAASRRSPSCHLLTRGGTPSRLPCSSSCSPSMATPPPPSCVSASSALPPSSSSAPASLEKQFEDFRVQLDETASVRERIRAVVMKMEATVRLMNSRLLLVHHSLPNPDVLEKARAQAGVLKGLFGRLADILRECPGQYYRFHGDWRSETQTAVSLIAFLHWLDTGSLLMHPEAEKILGLDSSEFGLDIEDYLIGLCFMSNELPRYVVNQVTAGDYDCPRKVLKFLTDLHASFRMLNLRNDFLRKKFDGMKYELRRVEEVYYDVKIRGLGSADSTQ